MVFAGKISIVCLLAGILTLGEFGIQTARPDTEASGRKKADAEMTGIWDTKTQMEEEYRKLEEEEEEKRTLLETEKEAGQTEAMELQKELRRIQVQKMVLKSRIHEKYFDK